MDLPAGKQRLLKPFFTDPWAELHQRELARRGQVAIDSAHRYLGECVEARWLLRRDVSNMTFFRPNWESEELLKIFEWFELVRRREFLSRHPSLAQLFVLVTDLLVRQSEGQVQLVMLHGAVNRKTWEPKDEAQLLLLASAHSKPINQAIARAKTVARSALRLSTELATIEVATTGMRERRAFHQETWGDRVVLYNEFLFWQLVRRGLAPHR